MEVSDPENCKICYLLKNVIYNFVAYMDSILSETLLPKIRGILLLIPTKAGAAGTVSRGLYRVQGRVCYPEESESYLEELI